MMQIVLLLELLHFGTLVLCLLSLVALCSASSNLGCPVAGGSGLMSEILTNASPTL